MTRHCGKLVVFEGPDGVGKTTLSKRLHEYLTGSGTEALLTSFPGQTPGSLAAHIYRLYHEPQRFGVNQLEPYATQTLVTAAHIEVIQTVVLPALQRGALVILDRYWWSTWVYGQQAGAPLRFVLELVRLEELVWNRVRPTRAFLISRSIRTNSLSGAKAVDALSRSYRRLARREAQSYAVHAIANDGTVDAALQAILGKLRSDLPSLGK